MCAAHSAAAADTDICDEPGIKCIVVLPVSTYLRSSLWEAAVLENDPASKLEQYLLTRLQVEPQLRLVTRTDFIERLKKLHAGKIREAKRLRLEGERYYEIGDLRRAVRSLEKSLKTYRESYYDVIEPEDMADLLLILAHARSERTGPDTELNTEERSQASRELAEMFFLDPSQKLTKGFYPPAFEDLLEDALSDFRTSSLRRENRIGVKGRLRQFQDDIGAETVLLPYLEREGQDIHVRISIFDREVATARFESTLDSKEMANSKERLDRFISAWLTCLPTGEPVPSATPLLPRNRFFIDTGFAYSIYGQFTTRRPFHNLGMGISAEYQFLRGLGVFAQVNLFTSTLDADRDLLDSFTSVRTSLGLSYAFRGHWWRVYVRFGFDVHFLGSYVTTTDPWCKFTGKGDTRCADSNFTDLGTGEVTMGIHGAFGVQFFVSKHIYLAIRTSTSAYIVPLSENTVVNFPFNGEFALGYSF